MGIKDVKARLPFTLEDMFKLDRVVIDAANLMFLAMLKQAKAGFTEDLDPALNEFQYMLNQATGNFSEIKLIFDGLRWEQKVHEHFRRQRARELALEKVHAAVAAGLPPGPNDLQGVVQNTARFSLMCIKLCKAARVPFVVAPFEADPQLVAEGWPIVSYGTDMLALGGPGTCWVCPEPCGWSSGTARVYRMDQMARACAKFPLVAPLARWGGPALQLYGLLRGCDFTEEPSGVCGCGFEAAVGILTAIAEPTVDAVVAQLTAGACPRMADFKRARLPTGELHARLL